MASSQKGIYSVFPQIMSRNMYCDRCAKNEMPFPGNIAVFFGEKRKRYFYEKIEQDNSVSEYGFTPHLIYNPSIITLNNRQMISFFAYCGIHGCGVSIDHSTGLFSGLEQKSLVLSIENFIAFMNNKDRSFYVNSQKLIPMDKEF